MTPTEALEAYAAVLADYHAAVRAHIDACCASDLAQLASRRANASDDTPEAVQFYRSQRLVRETAAIVDMTRTRLDMRDQQWRDSLADLPLLGDSCGAAPTGQGCPEPPVWVDTAGVGWCSAHADWGLSAPPVAP